MGMRARGANGPPELVALGVASVMVLLGDGLIFGLPRWPFAQFSSYEDGTHYTTISRMIKDRYRRIEMHSGSMELQGAGGSEFDQLMEHH